MKHIGRIKWGNVILMAIAGIGLMIGMFYAFVMGVVNYTYTYNPPTEAEIADDPSLVRYLK